MTTIDTNMSLVMIDPNEPLELYDGTIIKGRLEWFLYALCCLDYGNLPTPLSRIEEWANALITNELPNMEPQSRAEEFFKAILTGDTSNLPTPQSRSEVLLDKLARGENDFTNVEKIQSRYEFLLAYLIKNGGGIGNIDYVLYKFQKEDETLYNTKERPVKSVILSGNTLVNISPFANKIALSSSTISETKKVLQTLNQNTKYILIFNINNSTSSLTSDYVMVRGYNTDGAFKEYGRTIKNFGNGKHYILLESTQGDVERIFIASNFSCEIDDIILTIYQEGMENWDIPYFTGMQSVKMPVLTTIGKNLADFSKNLIVPFGKKEIINNQLRLYSETAPSLWNTITKYNFYCEVGEEISIQFKINKNENGRFSASIYDGNVLKRTTTLNSGVVNGECKISFVATTNNIKIEICPTYGNDYRLPYDVTIYDFQIEKGDMTQYKPFKSNILHTPEEVVLRSLPNGAKDTLNLNTGEYVQRIKEVTFDGSNDEGWVVSSQTNSTTQCFDISVAGASSNNDGYIATFCDKLPSYTASHLWSYEKEGVGNPSSRIRLRLNATRLSTVDVAGLRTYLQSNPITVQYELATPIVKTVDLTITDQGGATIPKLKTFDKITHVNVSATDILPGEVEMEVATTIGEDLSGTLYSTMEDIETKQEALKESNNAQTESINSTMMGTTEIYESLL